MGIFKSLSVLWVCFLIAGCFPGERQVFEEQELQISASREDEVSVTIATAIQNELSAYFVHLADDGASQTGITTSPSDIVTTGRCQNGVFAYIGANQSGIKGLTKLDKGAGVRMVRMLSERFSKGNVGYQSSDTISGIENLVNAGTDCYQTIQSADIAIGSPIVALTFANVAATLPKDFSDQIFTKAYSCESLAGAPQGSIGSIRKECVVSYQVDSATGQVALDQSGVPVTTQTCQTPNSLEIADQCIVADVVEERNISISSGISVGTDWSEYFSNPSGDTTLMVKCFSVEQTDANGNIITDPDSQCEPFDPSLDDSIVVECDQHSVPIRQVINPVIQDGLPVPETDSANNIIARSCGFGWQGYLTADYETRECNIFNVNPVTGEQTLQPNGTRQTIYQIYNVAAQCEKEFTNQPIACPIGIGSVFVKQDLSMTSPLALQPHDTERGENAYSTIAISDQATADVLDRVNDMGYFLAETDLNGHTDNDEFDSALVDAMRDHIARQRTACNLAGQTCQEPVLPPITMMVVDRSGSMGFAPEVDEVRSDRRCRTRLINLFQNPGIAGADENSANFGSCNILDRNSYGSGSFLDYSLLVDDLKAEYLDGIDTPKPWVASALNTALQNRTTCELLYDDTLGEEFFEGRICQQGRSASICQIDTCPGECQYLSPEPTGNSEPKMVATDHATTEVLIPELQYGSTFLYSYFIGGSSFMRQFDLPWCKLVDNPTISGDDALPFCDDNAVRNQIIDDIKTTGSPTGIHDLTNSHAEGGGTPLFSTLNSVLDQLQEARDQRAEAYLNIYGEQIPDAQQEIALYLMSDGGDNCLYGGSCSPPITSVCGLSTQTNTATGAAFSALFKERFPDGKLYILNLPASGGVPPEVCLDYVINDPNNPGTNTVDEFFEFNLGGESFADVFGDIDTAGPVDPYEICAALDLPYPTHTYEDDSVVGDTVSNPTGSCEIGQWVTPQLCLAPDGQYYNDGSPQCSATCYTNQTFYYAPNDCQCPNTPSCGGGGSCTPNPAANICCDGNTQVPCNGGCDGTGGTDIIAVDDCGCTDENGNDVFCE